MKRLFDAARRQYTMRTVSGKGSAVWTDGVKCVLPSVKLLGQTEQQSYAGRNLFDRTRGMVSGNAAYERLDDSIRVTGDEGTWLSANMELPETLVGQTVTIVGDWETSGENTGALRIEWMNGSLALQPYTGIMATESGTASTGVIPAKPEDAPEDAALCLLLYANTDGTAAAGDSATYRNVMVSIGESAAPYEPYVGGMPSPSPLYPQEVQSNNSVVKCTDGDGTYDGGTAAAPPLLCAADGTCQSTYDSQTGEFVNWWWDKIKLDGSEAWLIYTAYRGFYIFDILPEKMNLNSYWCNIARPGTKGSSDSEDEPQLWCGFGNKALYYIHNPFFDDTLADKGRANWKAWLAEHPLEVWVARNHPEITQIKAQPLTCPTGSGWIQRVEGALPDAPVEVRYLAHG